MARHYSMTVDHKGVEVEIEYRFEEGELMIDSGTVVGPDGSFYSASDEVLDEIGEDQTWLHLKHAEKL